MTSKHFVVARGEAFRTLAEWLHRHSSPERVVPPAMGAPQAGYAPLDDAPGQYVRQR